MSDPNEINPPTIVDESAHTLPVARHRSFLIPHVKPKKASSAENIRSATGNAVSPPTRHTTTPEELNAYYQRQHKGWNTYLAVYVKRIGQRAGGYKWMHGEASKYYDRCYQYIGIICILANTIATAGDIPYVTSCQTDLNAVKIAAIILAACVTLLMTFNQFKSFGARSESHTTSEANFAALYEQIKTQLQRNSKDRQSANDYLDWVSDQYRNLKEASPAIPPWIWKKYRIMIHDKNVADPEGVDEIVIKRDSPILRGASKKQQQQQAPVEVVIQIEEDTNPRYGLLTREDEAKHTSPPISEKDKIALERWKDQ